MENPSPSASHAPASLPSLTIIDGPEPGKSIPLTGDEIIIGRDQGCTVVIPSPAVSRRHVRLFLHSGVYWIEDPGSSNGTFVNGQRLTDPRPLQNGDHIHLGKLIHLGFSAPSILDHADAAQLTEQNPVHAAATEMFTREITRDDLRLPGGAPPAETRRADAFPEPAAMPPQLIISVAGSEPRTYTLAKERLTLGRSPENDIVIPSPIVSSRHAALERDTQGGYTLRIEPRAANPVYFQGQPLSGERAMQDGDMLRIGSQDPGSIATIIYQWPAGAARQGIHKEIAFGEKNLVQIGRDPSNDVVLDAPIVSRFHAAVERIGQRYRARDLGSTNGVFVNDQLIAGETWLTPGDSLRIGPYRFVLGEAGLDAFDETHGLRLEALGLNKWVRKDLNLLKDLYLLFQPREFVVVVGQSGGGKSTLVDAIAGYRPATHGQVLVNNTDIYRHFDAIRNEIGFVPQKDIIHMELTVYQALDYAARLRMPTDTSAAERHQRILEVLQDLDLTHRKDVQISGLSGGQQKRVSIGVELLTRPGLFFLDEPSSGLDPGTETALMHLMRRLADQGRTIILITHATKNVMLADKVVFLARGGHLAWFGPPDEALKFFDGYRSERDRRSRLMEFDEIYAILDDPSKGNAEAWAARYKASSAYQQHLVQPLAALGRPVPAVPGNGSASVALPVRVPTPSAEPRTPNTTTPKLPNSKTSSLRQFSILSSRNLKILTRDRISMFLMLIIAPLVAMVDVLLSFVLGRDLFDYNDGNMGNVIITLFQPAIFAVLVGALSMMREFVKESDIYRRERLVNLKVLPYVLSKFWVAALLALYQAAAYVIIHYLAFRMPGGWMEFGLTYVTLVLATLAGMSLGLLASAVAPNANAAPLIVILLIVPQVALGGALIPVPSQVTAVTSTRWALEPLVSITGAGSDVAADACWDLPEEEREALSLEDKTARGCLCMGLAALRQDSCSFPGVGQFYDIALDQPEPLEPAEIGDPPAEPALPPEPQRPTDPGDRAGLAKFFSDLQAYQDEVARIRDDYRIQIDDYQARADAYKELATQYQEDRAQWEIDRTAAVSKAEALIKRFKEDFGFTFVNTEDRQAFWLKILRAWGVQAGIITLLFALILVAIYRKQ